MNMARRALGSLDRNEAGTPCADAHEQHDAQPVFQTAHPLSETYAVQNSFTFRFGIIDNKYWIGGYPFTAALKGVRLENAKYPTLSLLLKQHDRQL